MTERILITGSAGFIGYHLSNRLLNQGHTVLGIDNLSDYYDVTLKQSRTNLLLKNANFAFVKCDICDREKTTNVVHEFQPTIVVHLAAQAGVRYSLENPQSYFDTNLSGTFNLMEICKEIRPKHFLMASTSSVYGANKSLPFHELQQCDHQISLYAATKKAAESLLHSYSHSYEIPVTMFRFFTVYGPWGRPDMALFKFTKNILVNKPIEVYNHGEMKRDFTYVEDLVESISDLIGCIPKDSPICVNDSLSPVAKFRIVNIGNEDSIELMSYIAVLEKFLGQKAKINFLPMQAGDVAETLSSSKLLSKLTYKKPNTKIEVGIKKFVNWYLDYYGPHK